MISFIFYGFNLSETILDIYLLLYYILHFQVAVYQFTLLSLFSILN